MKKFILILITCLVSLFSFTACNVVGGEEVTGVAFVHEIYYVDLGVTTKLDYEVFPKSAKNYIVDFTSKTTHIGAESEYYRYEKDGSILIKDERFREINFEPVIIINNFKDECEIRLREYPKTIEFDKSIINLWGGTAISLELDGEFEEGTRACRNGEFNLKVTSSNPSVVEIIDANSLLVKSTGRRGSSDIEVSILDSQGIDTGLKASVHIDVNDYIKESFVTLGSNRLQNGNTVVINASVGDKLDINVNYFDQTGFLLENSNYYALLSNLEVVGVDSEENATKLEIIKAGKVYLTIQSQNVDENGNPVIIKVLLDVRIS